MTVAVITDSAASLPPELAEATGVRIVPMRLVIGDEDVADGDLSLREVLARFDDGVTTSAPAPGVFLAAIEQAHRDGADGVLVVTVAASVSATNRAASIAATMATTAVSVLDTGTGAGAQGLVVLAAAQAARSGAVLADVEAAARHVAERVRLVASVPGLEQLARSGRVPGAAGWAGRRLGIQPLFEFRYAEVHRLLPAQSRRSALDRIFRRWQVSVPSPLTDLHITGLHAGAELEAGLLLERVTRQVVPATCFVAEFSSVMVTHTGPGLIGLAWYWEDPEAVR